MANTTQGFRFKLVANGTELDLFQDEEITISDNVTGLFDLGELPSEVTRQITLPGTKKNNAFFEHVYDISVQSPFLFETNVKVPCYFDFGGFYLSDGYLQLNRVNVLANKFIDSYEVTVFGGLSSFARDVNKFYLTDLTSSLSAYNHTASLANITASWSGNLFNGDIVYPMAEYGQKLVYSPEINLYGIDEPEGAMTVQDYKPAIRLKKVWDAIFEEFGYTYTGSFFSQPFLNDIYLHCNNNLRYPIFDDIDLETYGQFKISPLSGSNQTDLFLDPNAYARIPWFNVQSNPGGNLDEDLGYTLAPASKLRGNIRLQFEMLASGSGNGVPQFDILIASGNNNFVVPLTIINEYMQEVKSYNDTQTRTQTFTLEQQFQTPLLLPNTRYLFYIRYTVSGTDNFDITLNKGSNTDSYLEITKVNQAGDRKIMKIAPNMPFGTSGIKLIDFIKAVQKKFNLVIYPSKIRPRQFIVETFNHWYKKGSVVDLNQYVNLDSNIQVIPANNLAVNELNFGDTLDKDYISQTFNNLANREYGKTYFVDTENFFSQGKFEVQSGFASSPLVPVAGTGASGSFVTKLADFRSEATATITSGESGFVSSRSYIVYAGSNITDASGSVNVAVPNGSATQTGNDPSSGFRVRRVNSGDEIGFVIEKSGAEATYDINKILDSGTESLFSGTLTGTGSATVSYDYEVTKADAGNTVLRFETIVEAVK